MIVSLLIKSTLSLLGSIGSSDLQVPGNPLVLAPRGGVMMVPVVRTSAEDEWTDEIKVSLVLDSGRKTTLTGHLGWMEPIRYKTGENWSRAQFDMKIRSIRSDDLDDPRERMRTGTGAQLLIRLPEDGSGSIRIGNRLIPLQWMDLPDSMPAISVGGMQRTGVLEAVPAYDHPSTSNAMEWWRWELLAERLGLEPPTPAFGSEVENLAADHSVATWRIAMTRLNKASRGVASTCRDLLTETCMDGDVSIAAWITNPNSIGNLIQILLNTSQDDEAMITAALGWADEQISQFTWIQQPYGPDVNIQIANPEHNKVLAELVWSSGDDVPLGVLLEPYDVTGVNVERTPNTMKAPFSRMDVLNIVLKEHVQKFSLGDDVMRARPPGPILGPFAPTLTLGSARTRETPEAPPDRVSWMQLRRINDSWELYIECLIPESSNRLDRISPEQLGDLNEMRGIEAVTILMGTNASSQIWPAHCIVITPEDGWRSYLDTGSGTPEIEIRRQDDRWLANMKIPASWLPTGQGLLKIAAIRTHSGDDSFETTPTPCVPWKLNPRPAYIDLDAWDQDDQPSLRGPGTIQ
ncbi:MAG: hypothetical protein CMJ40_05195 [Phycisphaerae bacterium]|nr:hypothetical protein [Phycisphaerae bacterium]